VKAGALVGDEHRCTGAPDHRRPQCGQVIGQVRTRIAEPVEFESAASGESTSSRKSRSGMA
jgi:hypothetical protein